MNKCVLVLGAVAVATLAGCKDPNYKRGDEAASQNQVKPVEATPAPAPVQPIAIEPVVQAKCMCAPGTKHTVPCACGAPDCRCIVEPQKVIVAPVKQPSAEVTTYVVQRGDSLSKISKKFNIRVDAIRKANPKLKGDMIRLGQKLALPGNVDVGVQTVPAGAIAKPAKITRAARKPYAPYSGNTKEYVVKNGDTLGGIAYANGISIRQLQELNGLKSTGLRVGQKLKIPASGKAAKASAKAAVAEKAKAPKAAADEAKPVAAQQPAKAEAATSGEAEAAAALSEVEKTSAEGVPPAEVQKPEGAAAAPEPAQPEVQTKTYVVQDGDDMTGVSLRYAVSPAVIRELNNLDEGAQLQPGQIIKLPVANLQ